MATNPRIRLKDIAEKAQLSVAAVSMAMKNDPTMAKATVEKVKKIAEEMGYSPDPALSALSAYRSKLRVQNQFSVLGLVTNWSTRDGWSGNPLQKDVIEGAKDRALKL